MQVDKIEPAALAKQEEDRVFPIQYVLLVAGTLGSLASLTSALVFYRDPVVCLVGGLIGASLGLGGFWAITRHRVHSVVASLMGAILAPGLSATLLIVCLLIFDPGMFSRGSTSHGQMFDDESVWWIVYLLIVLPVSLVVGPVVGNLLNRRLAKS